MVKKEEIDRFVQEKIDKARQQDFAIFMAREGAINELKLRWEEKDKSAQELLDEVL